MSALENAAPVRHINELFDAGDLDGRAFECRDGFMGFMARSKVALADVQPIVTHQVAARDHVANERTWPGTHSGPPTSPGRKVALNVKSVSRARFCEVWRITASRIPQLVNYLDVSALLRLVR